MNHAIRCLLVLSWMSFAGCAAPEHGPAPQRSTPALPGSIEARLYPADFVLAHAREIELAPDQRAAIDADLRATQLRWDTLGANLARETAELERVLDSPQIDPAAAGEEAADVVRLEAALKQTHLGLLVRIHNVLGDAQRRELDRRRAR